MVKFDLIIPVYNEGKNLVKLLKYLKKKINSNFKIYICYDDENDNLFDELQFLTKTGVNYSLVKNSFKGPCEAVKTGLVASKSECKIIYPADDFLNGDILDAMYKKFLEGNDIVVASRFMKGGSMKNCPLVKAILVRFASYSLYILGCIPVQDASNGFRLFSKKFLNSVKIDSKLGFAYSLELLVKGYEQGRKICEIPAQWEERHDGKSNFKIFYWLDEYIKWYFYGLKNSIIKKKLKYKKN